MGNPLFTPEELAELAAFDAEIDESDITADDIKESGKRDRQAVFGEMDNQKRKIAENQRAYREANREKWNAYQREYKKRRRTHGENQSSKHHHPDSAGRV